MLFSEYLWIYFQVLIIAADAGVWNKELSDLRPTCSVFSPYWTLPQPIRCVDVSGMFFLSLVISWEVVVVAPRQPDSWWRFTFCRNSERLAPICRPLVLPPPASSSASSSSASAFSRSLASSCFPSVLLFARLLCFPLPPSFSSRPLPSFPRSCCATYYAAFRALFAVGRLVWPAVVVCCCCCCCYLGVKFVVLPSTPPSHTASDHWLPSERSRSFSPGCSICSL